MRRKVIAFVAITVVSLALGIIISTAAGLYDMTVRVVSSTGTVLNGTASAVTALYDKTVRIVNSSNQVIDSFGSGGATPTALSALPTCTAGGIVGSRAFIDNNQCNYAYGQTPLATTAPNEKCVVSVFCGSFASSTTAGTPVTGWIIGKNGKRMSRPTDWQIGRNEGTYYPGSPISGKGLLEW